MRSGARLWHGRHDRRDINKCTCVCVSVCVPPREHSQWSAPSPAPLRPPRFGPGPRPRVRASEFIYSNSGIRRRRTHSGPAAAAAESVEVFSRVHKKCVWKIHIHASCRGRPTASPTDVRVSVWVMTLGFPSASVCPRNSAPSRGALRGSIFEPMACRGVRSQSIKCKLFDVRGMRS